MPASATTSSVGAVTADGVALALRRFRPAGSARAVLLCTHAMMARGRYQWRLAEHLAAAGIDVFVLDWRGHGESVPPSPRDGDWCFDDYVELDLPAAMAAVCRATGRAPREVAYLGHSLGGLAGLAAFGTGVVPPPRRLALWATSVWLPGECGPRHRRWIMAAYRALSLPRGYAPIRLARLGTDDETRGYVEQLTGWARSGRWTSRTGVDYLAALSSIETATMAVSGAGDRLCVPDDARVLTARLPGCGPLRVVGRRFGDALDPDHFQLFTDPRMAPVWDELAEFVIEASP